MATYRLALVGRDGFESEIVTVLHYQNTLLGSGAGAQDLAETFEAEVEDAWEALMASGYEADQIQVRNVSDPDDGYDLAIAWVGARAGEVLPAQNCIRVTYKTATFSRRGRGASYLPGATESDNTGGLPTAPYRTAVAGLVDIWQGLAVGVGPDLFEQVIYSSVDQIARPVTARTVSTNWSTMRRRKPGVGS